MARTFKVQSYSPPLKSLPPFKNTFRGLHGNVKWIRRIRKCSIWCVRLESSMTWKDFKGKKMEKEGGTLKVLSSAKGGACRLLSSSFSFSMSAVWTMVAASEGAGEGWQNSLLSNTHVFFYNQPHARTHTHTYWRCCSLTCTDKKKQKNNRAYSRWRRDTRTQTQSAAATAAVYLPSPLLYLRPRCPAAARPPRLLRPDRTRTRTVRGVRGQTS